MKAKSLNSFRWCGIWSTKFESKEEERWYVKTSLVGISETKFSRVLWAFWWDKQIIAIAGIQQWSLKFSSDEPTAVGDPAGHELMEIFQGLHEDGGDYCAGNSFDGWRGNFADTTYKNWRSGYLVKVVLQRISFRCGIYGKIQLGVPKITKLLKVW